MASALMKAILISFPHVRVFGSIEGWGLHILASAQPIPPTTAETLAGRLGPEAARDLVEWGPFHRPEEQLARVLAHEVSPLELVAMAPEAPPLTDDRPVNEYFLVRDSSPPSPRPRAEARVDGLVIRAPHRARRRSGGR